MPFLVNGQLVSEDLIREESGKFAHDPGLENIRDELERSLRLRQMAEESAIGRVLLEQAAVQDPRPIDPHFVELEMGKRTGVGRKQVELQLRVERTVGEMTAAAPAPAPDEIEAFFHAHRENFRWPEMFHAAHIVRHVNGWRSEEEARALIEDALAELERGASFSEVAERYSDCRENGGDLGVFAAGAMVEEFEQAIRALEPGEHTGIFATPFGFHIAELRGKTPARQARFEEVRDDIERGLTAMNRHRCLLRAVAELRSRAKVERISRKDAETLASA